MQEVKYIRDDWRQTCLDALAGEGYVVLGPMRDGEKVRFRPCTTGSDLVLDQVNSDYPLKEAFLPKTERLLAYTFGPGGEPAMTPPEVATQKLAVLGCRPCDAAALVGLDRVFNWDYEDAFYNQRRRESLILSVGCSTSDDRCFCTSLGLAPDASEGSDLLIQPLPDGGARVTVVSDKGRAFAAAHADVFGPSSTGSPPTVADVPVRLDIEMIKPWLDAHFADDLWEDISLQCLGCGACSYQCPTCHCFDMVDETHWQQGERRRNHDCCSFSLFTRHTSGHNPRPTPASRWRNRLMHKFRYFVERFDRRACVGCGRCMRVCGAGLSLIEILKTVAARPAEKPVQEVTA